jgi:hypothetical protein
LIGCPPNTFHALTDAERKRATEFLAGLGGYAWQNDQMIYNDIVKLDAEKIHALYLALSKAQERILELDDAVEAVRRGWKECKTCWRDIPPCGHGPA